MTHDPNNLEGPPPTPEERAAMARELNAVAPTPGDKFQLMFNATPRTDALQSTMFPDGSKWVPAEEGKRIERELNREKARAEANGILAHDLSIALREMTEYADKLLEKKTLHPDPESDMEVPA